MQITQAHMKSRWKLLLVLLCAAFNVGLLIHFTKPNSDSVPFKNYSLDDPRYLGRVQIQGKSDESKQTVEGQKKQPSHKFVLQIDTEGEETDPLVFLGGNTTGETGKEGDEDFESQDSVTNGVLNTDATDSHANKRHVSFANVSDFTSEDQTKESVNIFRTTETEFPFSSKTTSSTHLTEFEFLINPSTTCLPIEGSDTYLVIGVCSAAQRVDFRTAIRETWGSMIRQRKNFGVRIVFIVGTLQEKFSQFQTVIRNESQEFRDIIQIKQVDHSKNLSFKTIAFLQWVKKFCKDAKFVMKSDDDVFINLRSLFKTLSDLVEKNMPKVMMGHLITGARPITDRNDPWFYPAESYSHRTYPDYLSGSAYIFPSALVSRLLSGAQKTPIFWLEDIYITGILTKAEDIKLIHNPRFLYLRPKKLYNLCRVSRDIVVLHGISTQEIYRFWKALKNLNC